MHYVNILARAFVVRTRFAYALALALVLSILSIVGLPASASAFDSSNEPIEQVVVDKADFYCEAPEDPDALGLLTSITPMNLSDEMKYFAKWESGQDYAQTFGAGDGYNAMGYYQFDRRYGLQNFIVACYNYDPVTFEMFAPYAEIDPETELYVTSIKKMTIREEVVETDPVTGEETKRKQFTEEAQAVIDAWKAAYAADPVAFSGLQDAWAYELYYLPARDYLLSYHGIDLNERADCVRGLCWGMSNLFGTGGWRKFVGGVSDGYDWDGVYHYLDEGVVWPGCGLTKEMTDTEFVTALCDYAIENIPVFYKGQPQYHKGWVNRYKEEKAICLEYLANEEAGGSEKDPVVDEMKPGVTLAPDVKETDWFVKDGTYAFVVGNGIIEGYTAGEKAGLFGPRDLLTRAQAVTILWRCANKPEVTTKSKFSDVEQGKWYSEAVNWAVEKGITTGYTMGSKAGQFGTNDYVTREQLATFIYRYAVMANPYMSNYDEHALVKMTDALKVSPYAKKTMSWCVDKGIISGVEKSDGMYALPQDYAQRAAMAAMIHRLFSQLV